MRDMGWAVRVLSGDTRDGKNEEKAESSASAREQILAARRKQMILVDIIITLQSYCRMFLARRRYEKRIKALVSVQRMSRRTSSEKEQQTFHDTIACVIVVQKFIRSRQARQRYQYQRKAAKLLQRCIRGSLVRCYLSRLRQSSIRAQAIVRGRRSRFGCTLLLMDVARAQAQARGCLTRKVVSELVQKRTNRFKQQIFLLWQRAHTPLAYRTKMWPLLKEAGFLSLTLAEGELQRLWTELDIHFPPSPRNQSSIKNDNHLAVSQQLGLSCSTYVRFTRVSISVIDNT
jgi:myosin heavy subunit